MNAMIRAARSTGAALVGAALLALSQGACGDPTRIEASFQNVTDTLAVFALSGTSVSVPTAIDLQTQSLLRTETTTPFDIAFDLDAGGNVRLIPAQLVTPGFGKTGFQKPTGSFESITRAPDGTYAEDSVLTVAPHETVAIRALPIVCRSSLKGTDLFAKLVVDSVHTADRTIFFRLHVDPNCGFHDLGTGVPKS